MKRLLLATLLLLIPISAKAGMVSFLFSEAKAQTTCPTNFNHTPQFTAGGTVFGASSGQWNSYFQSKVDANNGVLCNPTLLNFDPVKLFGNQSPNTVFAGPSSGGSGTPSFRPLIGPDLPLPSSSTIGGVKSYAAVSKQWLTGLGTNGSFSGSQPDCSDLSNPNCAVADNTVLSATAISSFPSGLYRRESITGAGSSVVFFKPAWGATLTFTGNPANNDTVTINGYIVTFVTGAPSGAQVQIGGSLATTIGNLLTFLQQSSYPSRSDTGGFVVSQLAPLLYGLDGTTKLNVLAKSPGNAYALSLSSSSGSWSSSTTVSGGGECTFGGSLGDAGKQVPALGGGCWQNTNTKLDTRDFGHTSSGTGAANTTAIQAAYDAAFWYGIPVGIEIPGTVNGPVYFATGVETKCNGPQALLTANVDGPMFAAVQYPGDTYAKGQVWQPKFKDCYIDGNQHLGVGILLNNTEHAILENINSLNYAAGNNFTISKIVNGTMSVSSVERGNVNVGDAVYCAGCQVTNGVTNATQKGNALFTSGTTAIGNPTLNFSSVPGTVVNGQTIINLTNPSSIPANTTVSSSTGTTIVMSNNAAVQVAINDEIIVGDTILHFAATPTGITIGSLVNDTSASSILVSSPFTYVISTTGTTVTVSSPFYGAIGNGDNITFQGNDWPTVVSQSSGSAGLAGDYVLSKRVNVGQSGTTNGTTAAGNKILHFAAVPTGVGLGVHVRDDTTPSVLAGDIVVTGIDTTAGTVTISQAALGGGVGGTDTILFGVTAFSATQWTWAGPPQAGSCGTTSICNNYKYPSASLMSLGGTYGTVLLGGRYGGVYPVTNESGCTAWTATAWYADSYQTDGGNKTNASVVSSVSFQCAAAGMALINGSDSTYVDVDAEYSGIAFVCGIGTGGCARNNLFNYYVEGGNPLTSVGFLFGALASDTRVYGAGSTSSTTALQENHGVANLVVANLGDAKVGSGRTLTFGDNNDLGLSRDSPGVLDCGNGAFADVTCTLQLKQLNFKGSTSGVISFKVPAIAGNNVITWPAGTVDFSATGGTSQVVKQTSAGGAFTVARLACSDLSNAAGLCSETYTPQTTYTPTITCGSGTIGAPSTQLGYYERIGNLTFASIDLKMAIGTCSGTVAINLPVNANANPFQVCTAYDKTLLGSAPVIDALIDTLSSFTLRTSAGGNPVVTDEFVVSCMYQN